MPRGQHGRHDLALDSPQRVSPVRSLPARISFIVFGATLFTSLVVTGISVRSIDRFLRGKIEQTFPATLESTSQRLELWYDQRLLELGVFASSRILGENLPSMAPGSKNARATRAAQEIEQYLEYVLGGHMAKQYPDYAEKPVRFQLDCLENPHSADGAFFTAMSNFAASESIRLIVKVVQPNPA